jgi:hypothetical protein
MEYLGVIVSKDGFCMDPKKIEGVWDWPVPKTVKQLQGFLGFANFYHQFTENLLRRCKGNVTNLRRAISLKFSQGKSKVNI